MNQFDEICLNYFLEHQTQLFREEAVALKAVSYYNIACRKEGSLGRRARANAGLRSA